MGQRVERVERETIVVPADAGAHFSQRKGAKDSPLRPGRLDVRDAGAGGRGGHSWDAHRGESAKGSGQRNQAKGRLESCSHGGR